MSNKEFFMNIEKELEEILSEFVEKKDITLESELSDLGLDSIDKANVLFAIEEKFSITFDDEEMFSFKTVGDVINSIKSKLNK